MTFIALDLQKNFMVQQKSALEFQQLCNASNLQQVTQSLAILSSQNADMESPQAQELQYYQQMYDQTQTSLESQLKEINAQIESFGKAIDTNIKSECTLKLTA